MRAPRNERRAETPSASSGRVGWKVWRWFLFLAGAAIVLAGLRYQNLQPSSRNAIIVLEAENAVNVSPPLEIVREAPERSFLRIPASADQLAVPVKAQAPGLAFELQASGHYYLWARTRWSDVCSNSVYARVDAGPVLMMGNDESFDRWHWVRHPQAVFLTEGRHTLTIPFTEPRIEIDRFVLANEPYPDFPGAEETGFLDAFAAGVPDSWTDPVGGMERVTDGQGCLRFPAGTAGHLVFAVRTRPRFAGDLYVRVRARETGGATGESDVAVLFDYAGPDQYRFVRLGSDGVHLGDASSGGAGEQEIAPPPTASVEAAGVRRDWDVEVIIEGSTLEVRLGSELLSRTPIGKRRAGAVGVGSRRGSLDVQSVEVRPAAQPHFQGRFYVDNRPLGVIDGFDLVAGSWRKGDVYATPFTYPLEVRASNGPALAVAGERWWSDYRVSTAVRTRPGVQAGLVFHYRDPKNFSILKVGSGRTDPSLGKMTLARCRDGACQDIAVRPVAFPSAQWSILGVETENGAIRGTLGDRVVIDAPDVEGSRGQVGLFAETLAEHPTNATRQPSLFLQKNTKAPFTFGAPLTLRPGDPGAALLFHYQGAKNHYRFSILVGEESIEARLDRVLRGHTDALQVARVRRPIGRPQDEDTTYNLGVAIRDGSIESFLDGKPLWTVPEEGLSDGTIAIEGLMPVSDADFDDFRVTPGEPEATSPLRYSFNPTRAAARDFASWEPRAGLWNIGFSTDDDLLYSLLGRTDTDGIAVFHHRAALAAPVGKLLLTFRPRVPQAAELEIAVRPSDPLKAPQFITLTLPPAPTDGGSSAPWLSTRVGGNVIARQQAERWPDERWHDLEVAIAKGGEVQVGLDGQQVLSAVHPPLGAGADISIVVRGAESTVFGFRQIRIETAP